MGLAEGVILMRIELQRLANFGHTVEGFPCEIFLVAAKVTVSRGLSEYRPTQFQFLNNPLWREIKLLTKHLGNLCIRDGSATEGIHHHRNRLGHTNGVGDLNFALLGATARYHIFRKVTGKIRRGAIHLGRILPTKCTSPVSPVSSIGVYDDFPPG